MGEEDAKTTVVCIHVINRGELGVRLPLESLRGYLAAVG